MTDFAALTRPFRDEQIHYRVGATNANKIRRKTGNNKARPTSGLALGYIDQRDIYDRLDEVCGHDGWQNKPLDAGSGRLSCLIGIRVGEEWIWKGDGAGGRQATQGLSEQDSNKGDFSDSLKRAAVAWGIGRYLYDMKNQWVSLNTYGGIADGMRELLDRNHAMLAKGSMPPAIDMQSNVEQEKKPSKADSRESFDRIITKLRDCETPDDYNTAWNSVKPDVAALPNDWQGEIIKERNEIKSRILDKKSAV